MQYNVQLESILQKMERYSRQFSIYEKKRERMGLSNEECCKYYRYLGKYLQWKYKLYDNVFDNYLMPQIMKENAIDLYCQINEMITWDCQLLMDDKELVKMKEACNCVEDVDKLKSLLVDLYIELVINLENYLDENSDDSLFREIGLFFNNGESCSSDAIKDHLEYKFEVMYMIIDNEGWLNNDKEVEKAGE